MQSRRREREVRGGRNGELLPLKVHSSNIPMKDANLIENLD